MRGGGRNNNKVKGDDEEGKMDLAKRGAKIALGKETWMMHHEVYCS